MYAFNERKIKRSSLRVLVHENKIISYDSEML